MRRQNIVPALLATAVAASSGTAVFGAEGGTSHYLPGLAGDLGFALPPKPGLQVSNIVWSQNGELDAAVLGDEVGLKLDLKTTLNIVAAFYTTDATLFGGLYTAGVLIPFGYAELDGELRGPAGNTFGFSDDDFALSDIAFIPLQLNWSRGNFHFKAYQSIIAPTGAYDEDDLVNLGRNHWSFDTVGAVTWFNPGTGTEVSFAMGLMHNAENEATDYHSGNESHTDWAINQFLTETFAIGLRGYRLNQLKGDSGDGAVLGPLEGFSQGYGAGFVWTPAAADGQLAIAGKYMRDTEARDGRFDSDYTQFTLSWTF